MHAIETPSHLFHDRMKNKQKQSVEYFTTVYVIYSSRLTLGSLTRHNGISELTRSCNNHLLMLHLILDLSFIHLIPEAKTQF